MSLDTLTQVYSQQPHLGDCALGIGGDLQLFSHYFETPSVSPKQLYRLVTHLGNAINDLGKQLGALHFPATPENELVASAVREGKTYHQMLVSWFADFQPALLDYARYGSDAYKQPAEQKLHVPEQQNIMGGLSLVTRVLFSSGSHFSSPANWAAYQIARDAHWHDFESRLIH